MADYIREISSRSLKAFGDALNDEEAGGSEFVRSTVSFFESRLTNLAVFRELMPGQLPAAEVQVASFGEEAPTNTVLVWSGAVIVDGSNMAVSVFR